MKEWFNKLSPTMQIVAVVIGLVAIFFLVKSGKNFFKMISQTAGQKGEEAAFLAKGQTKTFTSSQYSQFANKLEQAMIDPGTDESSIFTVFNAMKNDLDILALEQAFGIRSGRWQWTEYDLGTWLRDELGSSDMQRLNALLSQKGINKMY